jgi:hypothetical protein
MWMRFSTRSLCFVFSALLVQLWAPNSNADYYRCRPIGATHGSCYTSRVSEFCRGPFPTLEKCRASRRGGGRGLGRRRSGGGILASPSVEEDPSAPLKSRTTSASSKKAKVLADAAKKPRAAAADQTQKKQKKAPAQPDPSAGSKKAKAVADVAKKSRVAVAGRTQKKQNKAPAQPDPAALSSARSDALVLLQTAYELLPSLPPGPVRNMVEETTRTLADAVRGSSIDAIRREASLLHTLIPGGSKQIDQRSDMAPQDLASPVEPSDAASSQEQKSSGTAALPSPAHRKRLALVIGNSAYLNAVELRNPRNDARALAATFRDLGFDVVEGEDLGKAAMEAIIRRFADQVASADLALFFYAGHGIQVAGRNYLIPVDARLETTAAIDFETVDADRVLGYMTDEHRVGIALFDACRDNPLLRRFARTLSGSRSAMIGHGLAIPAVSGGGLLIAFATAPGDVAFDGYGKNSPFTAALLKYLPTKGLEIEQVLKKVKADVILATNNDQRPWVNSDIAVDIYLNP